MIFLKDILLKTLKIIKTLAQSILRKKNIIFIKIQKIGGIYNASY